MCGDSNSGVRAHGEATVNYMLRQRSTQGTAAAPRTQQRERHEERVGAQATERRHEYLGAVPPVHTPAPGTHPRSPHSIRQVKRPSWHRHTRACEQREATDPHTQAVGVLPQRLSRPTRFRRWPGSQTPSETATPPAAETSAACTPTPTSWSGARAAPESAPAPPRTKTTTRGRAAPPRLGAATAKKNTGRCTPPTARAHTGGAPARTSERPTHAHACSTHLRPEVGLDGPAPPDVQRGDGQRQQVHVHHGRVGAAGVEPRVVPWVARARVLHKTHHGWCRETTLVCRARGVCV